MKRRPLLWLGMVAALLLPGTQAALHAAEASTDPPAWKLARENPAELMRQTLHNELANSYGFRSPLRYRVRKISTKSDTTKEIVETREGAVARLIAVGGRPLSAAQERKEMERLRALGTNPEIEAHRRRKEAHDARRVQEYMRLLPTAFLYRNKGPAPTASDTLIRLTFTPNPKFVPPDFESRILTGIQGEVWIDPQVLRVVHIEGRIFKTVDFGWGILGSVYPGGTMQIQQTDTGNCGWQLTRLTLHLEGKALLFKRLHIETEETATDYQPVPKSWKYQDAVRWLLQTPQQVQTSLEPARPSQPVPKP